MENNDIADYPNREYARLILAQPNIARFIDDFTRLEEASFTFNQHIERLLEANEWPGGMDNQRLTRRLKALDRDHEDEMDALLLARFPPFNRLPSDASRETVIFSRFLHDRTFRGMRLLSGRDKPDFFRGRDDLTLSDMLAVYLWTEYNTARRPGDGLVRAEPNQVFQREAFLHAFHAYIHFTMERSIEYKSAEGKLVLRLAYKNSGAGQGGVFILTRCNQSTLECNTSYQVTSETTQNLLANRDRLEPAPRPQGQKLTCLREACGREAQFVMRCNETGELQAAYCSHLCYHLR